MYLSYCIFQLGEVSPSILFGKQNLLKNNFKIRPADLQYLDF